MQECELMDSCPFFNDQLKDDDEQIGIMKEKYCQSNNLNCARYMIFMALGRESVPKDLFPHQKEAAYVIIAESD